ncbi:MAG: tetratricopeptide repeat protein [Bacteroidota bacterium]
MSKKKKKKAEQAAAGTTEKRAPAAKGIKKSYRNYSIALALLAFLLYGNTLTNEYAFDDSVVITENQFTKKGFAGIPDLVSKDLFAGIYGQSLELTGGRYRPLTLVTHAIEYQLFGENPGVSHFINVLLYALCAVVLFMTLRKIFPEWPLFAFIVSLVFTVHPIHTEVVANIKSRDEILCFLFLMLSLYYLFSYIGSASKKHFTLSCVFYFLSLFSKENGITFLAVIPAALFIFTRIEIRRVFLLTAPYAGIAVLYLAIRAGLLDTSRIKESTDLMENPFFGISFPEKLATAFRIMGLYLLLLIFPHPLSCDYSYNQIPIVNPGDPHALVPLLVYAGLGVFSVFRLARARKAEQTGLMQLIAFGTLFYLATLSIVTNIFFNIGAPMGERFLFLPSLGFCIALTALFFLGFRTRLHSEVKLQGSFALLLGLIVLLSAYKTITRNRDWKDNLTLFAKDVQTVPNSAKIHYYYGNTMLTSVLNDKTKPERNKFLLDAKTEFRKAIAIYPQFHWSWYNLGLIYNEFGQADSAIYVLNKVLELQPQHINTQGLLGSVYGKLKNDLPKAIFHLQKAVQYNPNDLGALENLGIAYAMNKNYPEAVATMEKVLRIKPDNPQTWSNLGSLYGNMGDSLKAKEYFARARQLGGGK